METDGHYVNSPPQNRHSFGSSAFARVKRSIQDVSNDIEDDSISLEDFLKEHPRAPHLTQFYDDDVEGDDPDINNIDETLKSIDDTIAETQDSLQLFEYSLNRDKINERVKRIRRSARKMLSRSTDVYSDSSRVVFNNKTGNLECKVELNGKVNCSSAVYKDLKTWHANRLSIEDQIRRLKIKLEDLKEIRKHLKESRPEGANSDSDRSIDLEINTKLPDGYKNESESSYPNSNELEREYATNETSTVYSRFDDSDDIRTATHQIDNVNATFDDFDVVQRNFNDSVTNRDVILQSTTTSMDSEFSIGLPVVRESQQQYYPDNNPNYWLTNDSASTPTYDSNPDHKNFTDYDYEKLGAVIVQNETGQSFGRDELFDGDSINATRFSSNDSIISNLTLTVNVYVDKKIATPLPHTTAPSKSIFTTASTSRYPDSSNRISSLGPARLDITTYRESYIRGNDRNKLGINRNEEIHDRLPPFYIHNEDQHMCYCEPDR